MNSPNSPKVLLATLLLAALPFAAKTARAELITGASIDFEESDFTTPTASKQWTTGPNGTVDPPTPPVDTYIWNYQSMAFEFNRQFFFWPEESNNPGWLTLKATVPANRVITNLTIGFDAIRLYGNYGSGGDDQVAVQYSFDDSLYTDMVVYNNDGGAGGGWAPGNSASATLPPLSSEVYIRFAKVENTILDDPGRFDINSNFFAGGPSVWSYVQLTTSVVPEPSTVLMGMLGLAGLALSRRRLARRN